MTDASAQMPAPIDLTRLEQTIAELMARIATLQHGLDNSPSSAEDTGSRHESEPELRSESERITALRNALKDLGARMAVVTMQHEGANSPIPALVQEAGKISPVSNAEADVAGTSISQRIHALLAESNTQHPS